MFVLTAVSSISTSRAGSSIPCSRIHRRRARATSARCRSAACRAFFESDVVSVEKTPERTAAGFDPSLAQFCNRFYQGQVRLPGDQIQNLARELFQRRNAPAARLRGGAPLLIPALQPFYRRSHADLETLRRLASRRAGLHSCDNALPQVTRIGLRHPSLDSRAKCNRALREPDLHVFAKLFENCLKRRLEAKAFSGREIGGDDDVPGFPRR